MMRTMMAPLLIDHIGKPSLDDGTVDEQVEDEPDLGWPFWVCPRP